MKCKVKDKLLVFFCVISFLFASGQTTDLNKEKSLQSALIALNQSLLTQDYKVLKPYISDNFEIGGHNGQMAHQIIALIIDESSEIEKFDVVDFDGIRATVVIEKEGSPPIKKFVTFDEENLIRNISYFDDLLIGTPLQSPLTKDVINSPFEVLATGDILVKANVLGEEKDFVFDPSFPIVAFNEKEIPGFTGESANTSSLNVSGSFNWNGIGINNDKHRVGVGDLSHLKEQNGKAIAGVIGRNVIEDYTIYFDFENSYLVLN